VEHSISAADAAGTGANHFKDAFLINCFEKGIQFVGITG